MHRLSCCRFVHGDIKPENFLLGHPDSPQKRRLYLVDLGLTHKYQGIGGMHLPYRQIPSDFRSAFTTSLRACCTSTA